MRSRFNAQGAQWLPARPDQPELARWLAGDETGACLVKTSARRSVYALSPAPGEPPTVYLKHDHPVNPRDILKGFVRPKTRLEFLAGRHLFALGLPVAEPLAAAWRGAAGVLLTRAVTDVTPAGDLWRQVREDDGRRQRYLAGLRLLLCQLLVCRVKHPDFHLGNLMVREEPEQTRFFLVDVYAVRPVAQLSAGQTRQLLAIAAALERDLADAEKLQLFTDLPPPLAGVAPARLWYDMLRANSEEFYRRWSGRRKRLLNGDGLVLGWGGALGRWRLREGLNPETVEAAVRVHVQLRQQTPERLLKNGAKRCVSHVEVNGRHLVVKEFHSPGPWGRFAADARSWLANWGLEMCGFRVPACLGWLRAKTGRGYLVHDFIAGPSGFALLAEPGALEPVALYRAIHALIQRLYFWRILHGDLKLTNLIYHDDEFWLVDNDDVAFDRGAITGADWAANREQLLHGREQEPCVAALAAWLDTQPPPFPRPPEPG